MYRTNDGEELRSRNPKDVVRELRDISNTPTGSDAKFMQESADRIYAKLGRRVRHRSADEFVTDLLSAGLLINEEEG
jgi:hypothetical protein